MLLAARGSCSLNPKPWLVTAYRDFLGHDAALRGDVTDAMQEHNVLITKELFQIIMWDGALQKLMMS